MWKPISQRTDLMFFVLSALRYVKYLLICNNKINIIFKIRRGIREDDRIKVKFL